MSEESLARYETPLDEKLTRKRSTAQRRWRILAKALIGPSESISTEPEEDVSVRRFTSFDLFRVTCIENPSAESDNATWHEYTAVLENQPCNVLIRRLKRHFTANELIGFNNTGNICVWPSEECLAYYLLKNRHVCRNGRILELGGGMSCLAGVVAAKYCEPSRVTLTDGNVTSVNNVRSIVARNGMVERVDCGVLQWAKAARLLRSARTLVHPHSNGLRAKTRGAGGKDMSRILGRLYDVILCADCLFFDEARSDLVETIHGCLTSDGVALVMAPRRGTTFQMFAEAAVKRGFVARQIDRYDGRIWSMHLELLERSQEYCSDLHYPILLELTKQKRTPPG